MRLKVYDIEKIDDLIYKKTKSNLTKESSILEIFTDFKQVPPMIIEDHAIAFHVKEVMKNEHVRMKIVVNENNHFQGILPLACLTEEKMNHKILSEGFEKDNLFVKHCMIEKSKLQAIDYQDITQATIGEVIEALQHIGHSYCLVVEHKNHQIRGVIAASDISRALNIPVKIASTGVGTSFLDIFMRMKNS